MSDFTKEKIAFAVALLAVLFTVTPLLAEFGSVGFVLLGFTVTFHLLYYVLAALLALSVYCYGVQFAFERPRRFLTAAGDTLYTAAIVAPVAFALLFVGTQFARLLGSLLQSQATTAVASAVAGAISGAITTYLGVRTRREFAAKQREAELRTFADQSVIQLRRAEQLFQSSHYDLAIVEAFRAVESAVRRAAIDRGQSYAPRWFETIAAKLPTRELQEDFEQFRRLRNMAAHAVEPVTSEQARKALAVASRLLSLLSGETA